MSDVFDTPTDGKFRMYDGGTTIDQVKAAMNAKATISLQEYCSPQTLSYIKDKGQDVVQFNYPVGVSATDEFLMKLAELTGKPIPAELTLERGRLVDAIADSHAHIHGKRFAIYGDPDTSLRHRPLPDGTGRRAGAHPVHQSAPRSGRSRSRSCSTAARSAHRARLYGGKDLWHMRSLLFTDPVDYMIGNSYGKYLERDTKIPLIRLTYPIFDRHHHHRYPHLGLPGRPERAGPYPRQDPRRYGQPHEHRRRNRLLVRPDPLTTPTPAAPLSGPPGTTRLKH